jgi:hypothetical protein
MRDGAATTPSATGSYSIYRGLAVAAGTLDPDRMPDFNLTAPNALLGPFDSWKDPTKIVTIDPFGHMTTSVYKAYHDKGFDLRPTIAVTHAHIELPEFKVEIRRRPSVGARPSSIVLRQPNRTTQVGRVGRRRRRALASPRRGHRARRVGT